MAIKTSNRGAISSFLAMDVMQAASQRELEKKAVFHLEVGQPGTLAPKGALNAAKRALDQNNLGYTVAMGIPELREAISSHYLEAYNIELDSSRVMVTTGSSAGFVLSFVPAPPPRARAI